VKDSVRDRVEDVLETRSDDTVLQVEDLRTWFQSDAGVVRAVDGVSFAVRRSRTLGVVGESGSGKTVANLSILRLVPEPPGRIVSGSIRFDGRDLLALPAREMRRIRGGRISMIFQDPMTSLNPYLKLGRQLTEVLELHERLGRHEARRRAVEMLERVGIADAARRFDGYPHELSGGMRQRAMIAMALLCRPQVLIADEPTTALDVTVQAQILELLRELRDELGTAIILVTHDLGVVAGIADEVVVLYAGRIVEQGPTAEIFAAPRHPYTIGLLRSIPRLDRPPGTLRSIPGRPPDLARIGAGCPFAPRCDWVMDRCRSEYPGYHSAGAAHRVACWAAAAGELPDPARSARGTEPAW
jgi:oligopeptide transport system ATP-binding protein